MKLFEDDWGEDNSPIEDPEITQVIFYFSADDAKEFKKKSKELMKEYFQDYIKDGNVSDLLLILVKEKYENIQTQKTIDASASGSPEGNLFG